MPCGGAAAQLVILSQREQEYLLHAIEAALELPTPAAFFLWAQGQLQALLPHQLMVCLQFDGDDELQRVECLHGKPLAAAVLRQLADPRDGLALRLARHARASGQMPGMLATCLASGDAALADLLVPLSHCGFDNVLLHGTARLAGGASCFLLFGLPHRPGAREAYFLRLLLPHLHLALCGLPGGVRPGLAMPADADAAAYGRGAMAYAAREPDLARPLSARERQVLHWLREGKSNDEIAQILGISGLTVKNHLQRLYRLLGVSNRTHAVSRCMGMRLLERDPPSAPSARARPSGSRRAPPMARAAC